MELVTTALEEGWYRIGWRFDYQATNTGTTGQVLVQIDDAITLDEELYDVSSPNARHHDANFEEVFLTAGVHNIEIDIRRSSGGGTFTIDDGKIEIWRTG